MRAFVWALTNGLASSLQAQGHHHAHPGAHPLSYLCWTRFCTFYPIVGHLARAWHSLEWLLSIPHSQQRIRQNKAMKRSAKRRRHQINPDCSFGEKSLMVISYDNSYWQKNYQRNVLEDFRWDKTRWVQEHWQGHWDIFKCICSSL